MKEFTTKFLKPKALKRGDVLAAITLSWGGPATFPHRYEMGKRQLEETFGVKVIDSQHATRSAAWIYENPKARAEDLMAAFLDPSINGIISSIGGDESVRILPFLDLNVIRQNPKVFLGYSDTTATHFACLKAGLTSFYGPSIMAGFAENGGLFDFMVRSIEKTLFSTNTIGQIGSSPEWTVEHLDWAKADNQFIKRKLVKSTGPKLLQGRGKAVGHLIGGCVEVLEMLKGTEFWPALDIWKGAILFLETSEEAPNVDLFKRWIRNYGSQNILSVLNGIILGRPGGQIPLNDISQYDQALKQVIENELGLVDLPILSQMDFGHTDPMFVIPYGVMAEIDCDLSTFSILENAVI